MNTDAGQTIAITEPPALRPRVLFVGPVPPPIGGMSIYTEGYLQSRVATACDLRLLRADLIGKYRFTGLRRRFMNLINAGLLTGTMIAAIARHRPAIVHIATSSFGGFYEKSFLSLLARMLGCRVILHVHGGGFGGFYDASPRPLKWFLRRLLHCSHRVVALSAELRRVLLRAGVAPGSVVVLENAVVLPEWDGADQDQNIQSQPAGPTVVLFLSRIDREKGVFELEQAAEQVITRVAGSQFRIVGPDSEASAILRDRIRTAGFENWIELPGLVTGEAKAAAYRGAEIYVLPSHIEAMPLGLLEAMSYGLACVATPVGSIPEIISNGQNGLIVPVADVAALADAIERLLRDPTLRRRLGAAARRAIEERFDWDVRADQIISMYRQLVAG
ncbi:MAG: hypothetical protein AMXMBFR13_32640 [Phycisphaerae bacterium]